MTWGALAAAVLAAVLTAGSTTPAATTLETTNRNVQEWTNGTYTISFNVPNDYSDCTPRGLTDSIYTVGVPATYRLRGQVNVGYITGTNFVILQVIPINQLGDLNLTIQYPPHSQVVPHPNGLIEYHVEPQIEVYDEAGNKVTWVGGDQTNAPGTLGPGGQDWDVYCQGQPPPPPPPSTGGCTPGYWKQTQHFDSYPAGVTPTTTFQSVFGNVPGVGTLSWVDALGLNGGGINALIRHAAAAYLNAKAINFGLTPAQVVSLFQQAIAPGGNIERTKDYFARFNEQGCPLN